MSILTGLIGASIQNDCRKNTYLQYDYKLNIWFNRLIFSYSRKILTGKLAENIIPNSTVSK